MCNNYIGMLKIFITSYILFCSLSCPCQDFDYLQSLRTYWNYRYHLVGDAINRSQHFPSDCDFLKPSGTGEAGMTVVGAGQGCSISAASAYTNPFGCPAGPYLGWGN